MRPLGDWAGGDRGIAGYEDSGGSDLVMRDGILLGGTTSDGSGRPTIDIHGAYLEGRDAPDAERTGRGADAPAPDDEEGDRR